MTKLAIESPAAAAVAKIPKKRVYKPRPKKLEQYVYDEKKELRLKKKKEALAKKEEVLKIKGCNINKEGSAKVEKPDEPAIDEPWMRKIKRCLPAMAGLALRNSPYEGQDKALSEDQIGHFILHHFPMVHNYAKQKPNWQHRMVKSLERSLFVESICCPYSWSVTYKLLNNSAFEESVDSFVQVFADELKPALINDMMSGQCGFPVFDGKEWHLIHK